MDEGAAGSGSRQAAGAGLRYVLPFLRAYRGRLVAVFALSAVGATLGLTYPFFLQNAIDRIFLSPGEATELPNES